MGTGDAPKGMHSVPDGDWRCWVRHQHAMSSNFTSQSYWISCVDATIYVAQPLFQSKSYRDCFRRRYLDAALIAEARWSMCAFVSADEAGDDAMPSRENLVRVDLEAEPSPAQPSPVHMHGVMPGLVLI